MPRPTGRVLTLLELLQSGGTRTVSELADRLGVEGRTVRRYVALGTGDVACRDVAYSRPSQMGLALSDLRELGSTRQSAGRRLA